MRRWLAELDRRILPRLSALDTAVIARRIRSRDEPALLRLVREVPQVGFVAIALLLLADLAVVGSGLADRRAAHSAAPRAAAIAVPAPAPTAAEPAVDPVVGPASAQDVTSYLTDRRAALRALVRSGSTRPTTAVISFRRGVRPAELAQLTSQLTVVQVLVHVAVPGRNTPAGVVRLPGGPQRKVVQLVELLGRALAPAVAALRRDQADNQRQGDTTSVTNDGDRALQADFYQEAKANRLEADQLQQGGPYIYAVVLATSPRLLLGLANRGDIRLIDIGPAGLAAARARPRGIFPEDRAIVSDVASLAGLS